MSGKKCSRLMPLLESTKLCKFHAEGRCRRGEACTFAHSTEQIRDQPNFAKTRLCAEFKRSGHCTQGSECKFAHGNGDRRVRLRGQVLSASNNSATANITSEVQVSGASQMDSSAHELAVGPEIPEINTSRVIEQDDSGFMHEGSAHAASARQPFASRNGRFDRGEALHVSSVEGAYGYPVRNTFIEFADEYPFTPRRSSSLPAHLGRVACRPA
eukprot:TRINITY_DN7455_c0_g3_i1.p1 TRINITY_DN7455_c0_g3~~TRINITY_DN7455_c0_g3_i1.p1  ORF type:complete len:214 (+),score=25.89 TRINITY_DN7455_c0_g3_i1:50-691(+)